MARRKPPGRPTGECEILYGLRAGLAILERRPGDVRRIAYDPALGREGDLLAESAQKKGIPVGALSPRELERIAGTNQHEGVCLEVAPRRWANLPEVTDMLVRARGAAIGLDRVRNPYNVGAILRSAAFFGIDAAVLGAPAPHPTLDPLAIRVAEGGAEKIPLARTTDLAETLSRMRARGVKVLGADEAAEVDALGHSFARPTILVLGNEREGLGARVRAQCDELVAIRGSGAIESLNVAVAAGVLIAGLARPSRDRIAAR